VFCVFVSKITRNTEGKGTFSVVPVLRNSAKTPVKRGGKLCACPLPTLRETVFPKTTKIQRPIRVTVKNIRDLFHETQCTLQ